MCFATFNDVFLFTTSSFLKRKRENFPEIFTSGVGQISATFAQLSISESYD